MWHVWGRGEGCTEFWWGNLRERDHWGNPDADGRIILRRIFRKWEGVVGTGWSWLRVGMIYLLTAIGLTPGGSSTVHIYTQTVNRTTQNKQYMEQHNNLWECGPCPVLAKFTLAFALQLRKKHRKTSVRVAASKNT